MYRLLTTRVVREWIAGASWGYQGPISALAFKTSVDDPRRLRRSKTVGAISGQRRDSGSRERRSTFPATSPRAATASPTPAL